MLLWGEPPPRPLIVTVRVQEQALLRTPDFHRRAPTKGEGRSESSRSYHKRRVLAFFRRCAPLPPLTDRQDPGAPGGEGHSHWAEYTQGSRRARVWLAGLARPWDTSSQSRPRDELRGGAGCTGPGGRQGGPLVSR